MSVTTGLKHIYLQVKDRLRDEILDRNLKVGDKLPTISEIATRYKVGRDTAIKAIGELVREGVLESRRRAGITVRSIPLRQNAKRKSILAIVGRGPLFISDAMRDAIWESLPGWRLFQTRINSAESNGYCEKALYEFIGNNQYEAYLLSSVNPKLKQYFYKKNLPCMVVGGLEDGIDLPNMAFDEYERYYQATRYLLRQGYPNIAFIQRKEKNPGDYQREVAVCAAYSEASPNKGIRKPVVLSIDELEKAEGEKILEEFLSGAQFPFGVVSGSDYVSCWLLQTALRMGVSVPGRLGIITSGTTDMPSHTHPQLTSLRPDQTRLGFAMGRMLMQITSGYSPEPRHVCLPYESPYVVQRQTTKEALAATAL